MLRRKEGKMGKQREEEDEIDTRLKDAGLYEDGMPLDMKRDLLKAIEMSCQSARQEEEDRKQLKHEEQQLLADSLNKSLASGSDEPRQELGARDDEEEDMSSDEVVALPADKVREPANNSTTPDLNHGVSGRQMPSNSCQEKHQQRSHIRTPSKTPERSQSAASEKKALSGTPSDTQERSLNETHNQMHQISVTGTPSQMKQKSRSGTSSQIQTRSLSTTPNLLKQIGHNSSLSKSQQKETMRAQNWDSASDLFVSDSSTDIQEWKSSRRRLQMDNEANSSYGQAETSDSEDIIMESPKEASNSQNFIQVKVSARKPLRNEGREDDSISPDCSPSPLNSQPLFSSDGSWLAVQEDLNTLLMSSPVVGSQKSYPGPSASSQKTKLTTTSVQESTVTSSPQGKFGFPRAAVEAMDDNVIRNDDDDDEVDFIPPTPEVSQSYKRNSQLLGSQPSPVVSISRTLPGNKESQQTCNMEDDMMLDKNLHSVNFSLGTNFFKAQEEQEKSAVESQNAEEDSVPIRTLKQSKWNINVFCPDVNPSPPMKRGGVELQEDQNKAYMQHSQESQEECTQRILKLINQQLRDILEHQTKNITRKLKWSAPITVDRRLKNTLDRPKQTDRRQGVYQLEQPRRALRLALKEVAEEQSIDDCLPDLEPADDGWIEVQSKRQTRRKNRQLGLSRNPSKQTKQVSEAPESMEESLPQSGMQKAVRCDSDDDFEFFPSSSSDERKLELGKVSDMANKTQMSMSSSAVSSSVSNSVSKSKLDQKKVEAIDAKSQIIEADMERSEEITNKSLHHLQPEKQKNRQLQTSTMSQTKRAPRKTFLLPHSSSATSENSNKPSSIASIPEANEQVDEEVRLSPQPSTSSADPSDEGKRRPCQSGINNLISRSHQPSPSRQTPTTIKNSGQRFVSSSGVQDEAEVSDKMKDICIIEEDNRSGPSLAKYPRREARGKRGNEQEPIRPAIVKLKKSVTKSTNGAARSVKASENSDQSSSTVSQPSNQNGITEKADCETLDIEEEEKIECPLCQKLFAVQQIEIHASDCTGNENSQPTLREKPERGVGWGKRRGFKRKNVPEIKVEKVMRTSSDGEERAGVRCEVCKEEFLEGDEILVHTQSCQGMRDIENNIMSPASNRSQGRWFSRPLHGGGVRLNDQSVLGASGAGGHSAAEEQQHLPISKRGQDVLEYHTGDITEPLYQRPDTALVQIINCVAVRPHGLSEVLAKAYPYCDSYSHRKPVRDLNRAVREDRPQQGTIKICRPTRPHAPIVINVCGQFYMGKEFRKNVHAKRIISKVDDEHLKRGLQEDTAANRIKWFQEGLAALSKGIPEKINVNKVVFPSYIGCGQAGGDWLNNYLPAIKYFAHQMVKLGVQVIIVRKLTQMSDSDMAKQGTIYLKKNREGK